MATSTTPRGGHKTTTGVERIAHRARQEPQTRYTSLMHHCTVDNLRACFESLDAKKAAGVDGVTKAMYGQDLEANLQDLHQRLHQMSYRPRPVRRVEIPKEDGSTRPLGISCVEDKIVQEMLAGSWKRSMSRYFLTPRTASGLGGAVTMPSGSSTMK